MVQGDMFTNSHAEVQNISLVDAYQACIGYAK